MILENLPNQGTTLNPESDRQQAIVQAYAEIARRPVYLDTETTGLDSWDEILEICILDSNGSVLFESLVKPRGSISEGAYWVHRITKRMVKDAPTWEQVLPHVTDVLTGRRVAIYNADFDVRLFEQSCALSNLQWELDQHSFFCIMKLFARFYGRVDEDGREYRWQGLGRAARQCGIEHGKTHRAQEDARLARAVLRCMASHMVVPPPKAMLPLRRWFFIQSWLRHLHGL